LFGNLWGAEPASSSGEDRAEQKTEKAEETAQDEEEEGGGDTIKGEKASTTVPPSNSVGTSSSLAARSSTQSRTRLSALFTDWIAPEAAQPLPTTSPSEPRSRIVGGPRPMSIDLSKRFSSYTPGDRSSMMLGVQESLSEEEEGQEETENLESELESLMVSYHALLLRLKLKSYDVCLSPG
jgi:hypothetical protein